MPRYAWDVYRAAVCARWVGRVIAHSADAAIEAAAVEFKTNAWKLIAGAGSRSHDGVSRDVANTGPALIFLAACRT
jgi:hypothetical protein